jgi:hypothetical protein
MYADLEENLFYHMLVDMVKNYFDPWYHVRYPGDYNSISRWLKKLTRLHISGLEKEYTFKEYLGEFIGIPPSNAEIIRQMIVTYKEGDEETRRRVVRDCFAVLEENHDHNDPEPFWREYNLNEERKLRVIRKKVGPRRTYAVFS